MSQSGNSVDDKFEASQFLPFDTYPIVPVEDLDFTKPSLGKILPDGEKENTVKRRSTNISEQAFGNNPTQIFADDVQEEKGENARLSAFVGAIAVGDLVKSTLGPKGMDKILQSA